MSRLVQYLELVFVLIDARLGRVKFLLHVLVGFRRLVCRLIDSTLLFGKPLDPRLDLILLLLRLLRLFDMRVALLF